MAKTKVDLVRLTQAVHRARLVLRHFRSERREAVRRYVGAHWGEDGKRQVMPINLLSLYINVLGPNLIAKEPRVMIDTFERQHKAAVDAMQSWANRQFEHMRLAMTLQRIVLDALFSVGICKVALATPADSAEVGWNLPAGTAFAERVDLDDFVFDVHARDFSEASYVGHRYRTPKDVAAELFGKAGRELPASTDSAYNLEGDERLTAFGRLPYAGSETEAEDMVDLWEIYVPRKRLVLTLADSDLTGATDTDQRPLREQEWLGPDGGPYHFLAYGVVPGNAMPKAPIQDLLDLNDSVNNVARKLIEQARRQKQVLLVRAGATESGDRIIKASDGEAINVDDPTTAQVAEFGGPNQNNFAVMTAFIDRFSWLAGNLDIMGGLSPQSKTATQDKMLAQNASAAVADKQAVTVRFVAEITKALCWYWWKDPFSTMRSKYQLPGMPEFQTVRRVTAQQRQQVRFEDLEVEIDPYSMQHSTPQARVQALMQVVGQMQPFMALAQQQGVSLDINALLTKMARYLDLPDLPEILTTLEPPQQDSGPPTGGSSMPTDTTRNYVRESMPGRTRQGNDMNLVNTLMGANGKGNGAIKTDSSNGGLG